MNSLTLSLFFQSHLPAESYLYTQIWLYSIILHMKLSYILLGLLLLSVIGATATATTTHTFPHHQYLFSWCSSSLSQSAYSSCRYTTSRWILSSRVSSWRRSTRRSREIKQPSTPLNRSKSSSIQSNDKSSLYFIIEIKYFMPKAHISLELNLENSHPFIKNNPLGGQ